MDKLKQIETFIEVAEKGSLARAGLSQKISPAMLGRRIDALEKRLGVKLMHRTTRHLTLTEEGVAYLDHCTRLLSELDKAEQQIGEGPASRHRAPRGVGAGGIRPQARGPACAGFCRVNPEVRLSFNLTDQVVDLVREGYDLAYG